MPNVVIPLIGPAWDSRCKDISAQVTRGLYPEVNAEGKTVVSLHAFPGLKEFADCDEAGGAISAPGGAFRGSDIMNGILYVVMGNDIFEVASDGTATHNGMANLGTPEKIPGSERVDMRNDGSDYVIAYGAGMMFSPIGTKPRKITDADVTDPHTVDYLNGQFVFDDSDGSQFKTSQLTSALSLTDFADSNDVAAAEAYPDDTLRIITHNQLSYFFGAESREAWWNSGVGDPPFDRVQGSVRREGIAGRWAVTSDNDTLFFLDNKRIPRALRGFDSVPLGNPALGKEFESYSTVEDAIALTYRLDYERFFELVFPSEDRTWVWHEPTNSWFELSSGVNRQRHAVAGYEFVYGKHLFMHPTNSKIYELDFDTFTDAGETVRRVRRTANIHGGLYQAPGKELIFDRVHFDFETGVGIATGQGSDPQVMIRFSDDAGRTWSAEQWHPMGVAGDYLRRVTLNQQGRAYNRVYEVAYSEPTRFSLIGANADIQFGT